MMKATGKAKGMKAVLLAAAATTALLAVAVPPSPAFAARPVSEKSTNHLQAARQFVAKRNWNSAVIELKNALQADPNNVDARILLGDVYVKVKNGAAAEKEYRAALERGAEKKAVTFKLGDAFLLQRKFQEVIDQIGPKTVPAANLYDTHVLRGNAHLGLRQVDAAMADYAEAEKLNPKAAAAKIGQSRLYTINKDLPKAIAKVDEALKYEPRNVEAMLIKGELVRLKGDYKQAYTNFDAALAIEPDNLGALLGRAATLVELNRIDEGQRDLDQIFKRIPNHPMAHYLAARIAWQKKDIVKAREHMQATSGALDNFPPAIFLNGIVNYADNNLEQAAYHLSRLLEVMPDHAQARRVLAMTYLRQGDPKQAISTLQPVIDKGKPDAQIYSIMGYALMQAGELDKATSYFDKAVQTDPSTSGNWTRLAVSKLASGDYAEAEDDLEKVLAKDPKALQPAIILTMVHLRKNELPQALQMAQKLKAQHPENPVGSYLEGEVYLKDKKLPQARAAFEASQKQNAKNFAPTLKLAQIDIAEAKLDAAQARYQGILAKDKKNVAAIVGMADLSLRRKNTAQAITWLEQASEADQDNMNVRLQLISLYMERKEMDKADALANRLVQRFPEEPVAFEALGKVQSARGAHADAVASFERVVALRPDVGAPYQLLAMAEMRNNNPAGARDVLESGLKRSIKPRTYEKDVAELGTPAALLVQLVELDMKEKKFDQALAHADQISKSYPASPAGTITRGNILLEKGDNAGALKVYQPLLAKNQGGAQVAINTYRAQRGSVGAAKALADLDAWVAKNPKEVVARNVLASGYIEDRQYDKAIQQYETLQKGSPKDALILNNLAWLYQQKKDPKAVTVAAEAYKLAPQSPEVIDTYAWILVNQGQLPKGLELLKKAVVMRPGAPDIRYHLAAALEKNGQKNEAKRELQDLLALGVAFPDEKNARALLDKLSQR